MEATEARPSPGRRTSRPTTVLWWCMLLSCLGVAGYATQFFIRTPADDHFSRYIVTLRLHIVGGMGAMVFGPLQFVKSLRTRALDLHRWLGRCYLLSVLLGSVAGLAMATVSREGAPTHLGFGVLAILWFWTAVRAYRAVRAGDIAAHRRWMVRNFALSLAAVTLRNYIGLMLFAFHWSFRTTYVMVAWLCWIPNLCVAEWILRRRLRLSSAEESKSHPLGRGRR